ncbi:uncharacterized protein LOC144512970 [Sander vitreus]
MLTPHRQCAAGLKFWPMVWRLATNRYYVTNWNGGLSLFYGSAEAPRRAFAVAYVSYPGTHTQFISDHTEGKQAEMPSCRAHCQDLLQPWTRSAVESKFALKLFSINNFAPHSQVLKCFLV